MLKRLRAKAKQFSQAGTAKAIQNPQKAEAPLPLGQEPLSNPTKSPTQDPLDGERDGFADSPTRASLEMRPLENGSRSSLPDFMTNPNAVVDDDVAWRHQKPPNYTTAHRKYLKERTNIWPPGSLEDLVTNLIKNWKKEASHKARLEDWRTINPDYYRFSCNGGRTYTAEEMLEIGTSNALIQEAAFYSAQHTSFDDSHTIFQNAMPGGFCWEVTEVYSGPPVMAFKWRHWGQMTGKLVCPIGPDTKLEAEPSGHEVEVWGLCVAHLDPDFRMSKLEVFYDPHELMASLVDANNLSYKTPDAKADTSQPAQSSTLDQGLSDSAAGEDGFMTSKGSINEELADALKTLGGDPSLLTRTVAYESPLEPRSQGSLSSQGRSVSPVSHFKLPALNGIHTDYNGGLSSLQPGNGNASKLKAREFELEYSPQAAIVSLSQGVAELGHNERDLPSDTALLSALVKYPRKPPPGSRCPFPHS